VEKTQMNEACIVARAKAAAAAAAKQKNTMKPPAKKRVATLPGIDKACRRVEFIGRDSRFNY
jgi:hypothetical protein